MSQHGDIKTQNGGLYYYDAKRGWVAINVVDVNGPRGDTHDFSEIDEASVAAGMRVIAGKLYARAEELRAQGEDLALHDRTRTNLLVSADTMRATAEWFDPDHERNLLP